jgi:carbon storage regulator
MEEMEMLVLARKENERILIGTDVIITVVRIGPNTVKIGIEAPKSIIIVREEITDATGEGNTNGE